MTDAQRSLVLVKPDGVRRGLSGEILRRIEAKGYTLAAVELRSATPEILAAHYAEHEGKPFYGPLVEFMLSGPVLNALEPVLSYVVCTQNSTPRSMSAVALGRAAAEVFGEDRVSVVADLAEAIDRAATLAEAQEAIEVSIGSGAVLVTGSVVTVGEARAMLKGRQ